MKKILILTMLFFSLVVNAQTDKTTVDTSKIKFIELPDSTAIGTPDGTSVSKQIGPSGGRIVSDDGRVELIFPADALTANTTINIQPTTNPVIQGVGKAYQFEPSGTQFKKPVQLIFHYTKEETEACPAELMNFALQDHSGKWTFFKYENWDSTTRTLTGAIHHFTGMANTNSLMILPRENSIVAGSATIIDMYDGYRTRVDIFNSYKTIEYYNWAVNGVIGGNEIEGEVGATTEREENYNAPKIMPHQNPVTIHLFYGYYSDILKKMLLGVATCKIQVYDEYKVDITSRYTGRAEMHAELSDQASFVIRIYPNSQSEQTKFVFKDIQNYPPTVIKDGKNGPFIEKIIPGNSQGHIDITSHKNDKLSSDYPPKVSFDLNSEEVQLCEVRYKAGGIPWSPIQPLAVKPIPEDISFIANGEIQNWDIYIHSRDIGYKMTVTPHREEKQK